MRQTLIIALLIGANLPVLAQTEHQANITHSTNSNRETVFKSNASALKPQLRRLSMTNRNAPTPFIKHFWEFDDGTFTTNEEAAHAYSAKANRVVNIVMTPCYTLDKIKSASKTVEVDKSFKPPVGTDDASFVGGVRLTSNLALHNIKAVRAKEQFISIISYRNVIGGEKNAKLYLFYNKKDQVKAAGRILIAKDLRLHGATEGVMGQELTEVNALKNKHYDAKVFRINNLSKNSKNLFITFEVDAKAGFEKIKELDMTAALVVDGSNQVEKSVLSFEPAASYDPNNMKAPRNLSFRFINNKLFKYRINFENLGNAPAQSLKIQANIPEALDAFSIQNIKTSHTFQSISTKDSALKYTISPDGKIIDFDFKNIVINGAEEAWNPKKKETQGYVEYELRPKEGIKKLPMTSRASIIFDNNEPIVTDPAKTEFRTGISLGAKTGINYQPNTEGGYSFFIGATYSAYRPAKPYLQIELMADLDRRVTSKDTTTYYIIKLPISNGETNAGYYRKDSLQFVQNYTAVNSIRVVPAQMRYDVNKFFGVGVGVYADIAFIKKQGFVNPIVQSYYYNIQKQSVVENCNCGIRTVTNNNKTQIDYGFLGDLTIGKYSNGLALGLRYMQPLKKVSANTDVNSRIPTSQLPKPFFQAYLSYKIL